ncbi:MAG TPA: TonB-dependent receptor [Methylomirabilota bacterium]|nr:TonB-dependent receptor [Methylomirabilota bacterium]
MRQHLSSLFLCALILIATATPAFAQGATGTLTGTVVGPEGSPVANARLQVAGTRLTAASDRLGRFRLAPVPAGEQQLVISALGFESQTLAVEVEAGTTATLDVTLALQAFTGTVTVQGDPILTGQAQALNEQKVAPNIVNVISSEQIQFFPDTNAAEATQRVPGLFIQRDQGEGRYVLIRGTAAGLNRTQIDGEVIPAPEADIRQVALDVIPADVLETMRVSKALTPDQDADAIGGIVNLEFKDAPSQQLLRASVGGYYGDLRDGDGIQAGLSWGDRFADEALGFVLSASYTDITRNTENFEADSWDDGQPQEFETRDYNVNRERLGLVAALDWRPSDSSVYRVKGIYNDFADQEYRRRVIYNLEDNEIERELKDRFEEQKIWNAYFDGENLFDGGSLLSYRLSFAHAEEAEPKGNNPLFIQEDVEFDPFFDGDWFQPNPLNEDPGQFFFNELETNDNLAEEESVIARVDYSQPFANGVWTVGAKFRGGEKFNDTNVFIYEIDDDLVLSDYRDPGYFEGRIVQEQYLSGPAVDPGAVGRILSLPGIEGEKSLEDDLGDFDATEDVWAVYGMTEIYLTDSVMLLPGVRYEYTDGTYDAFELDEEEETLSPVSGANSYGELLPNVHLRWAVNDRTNLRAAVTRTLARPNFEEVVPRSLLVREDLEIERGNADLDPTTSWNLDLMFERYFTTVGVVSAGLFYKDLQDYIFSATFDEIRDREEWQVFQPLNGDDAALWGLELAYQNQFRRLPAPFDGFGVYLNYTWTDSEATLPERDGDGPLPGQSEQVGNIAVTYEKGFFSGILSYNIQGEWLEAVGDDASEDEWVDERSQLDFQAQFRVTPRWSVFAQLYNLTDEPYRRYVGTVDQPLQEEYYSWWGLLGVKFNL